MNTCILPTPVDELYKFISKELERICREYENGVTELDKTRDAQVEELKKKIKNMCDDIEHPVHKIDPTKEMYQI